MHEDPSAVTLVELAAGGDESAWDQIVRRYAPLVWSVCRRYGVTGADAEDIGGVVWLRLVTSLAALREPAALPGWIATITRRECLALLRKHNREQPVDDHELDGEPGPASDAWLLAEERRIVLRQAFTELADRDRQLLSMLFADPPAPYSEISATLGMPVGSIGPNRRRCLARLRRTPAVRALLRAEVRG